MELHTSAEMRLLLGAERGTSPAAGTWGQTAAGGGEQSIQRQKLVQEPGLGAVSWSCAEAKPRRSDLGSWGAAGAAGLQSRREMVGAAVLERGGEEGWGAALLGEGGMDEMGGLLRSCFALRVCRAASQLAWGWSRRSPGVPPVPPPAPLHPSSLPPSPRPSVCDPCSSPLAASLSLSRSPSSLGWILRD